MMRPALVAAAVVLGQALLLSQTGSGTFLVLRVDSKQQDVVSQVQDVIKRRLQGMGIPNPVVTPHQGTADQLYVLLPTGTDIARAKRLLRSTSVLEFKLVAEGPAPDRQALLAAHGGQVPAGMAVWPGARAKTTDPPGFYLVRQASVLSSSDIANARPARDEMNLPAVALVLNAEAVAKFARATGENVGHELAIIVDGVVQSAPRIQERIAQADIRITGNL